MGAVSLLDLRALIGSEAVLFTLGVLLLFPLPRRILSAPERDSSSWAARMIALGIVTVGVGLLIRSIATPITDEDSLAYHLPAMAKWYQTHAFVMLDQFYGRRFQISRYPYSWEALSSLFLLPLREDFLVTIPNLIAWTMFGSGIYLIAIVLGAGRNAALAFSFLALTMPTVRAHVMTMHVDLALGAFFATGVAFALRAPRDRFTAIAVLACMGMLAGIKTSGLVYAALLAVGFGCAYFIRPAAVRGARFTSLRAALLASGIVVAVVVASGFWYARNLVETGNPLGFPRVTVAGRTLFDGPLDAETIAATTLWRQFRFDNMKDWSILAGQMRKELGPLFLVSVLIACFASVLNRPASGASQRRGRFLLAGLLVATGLAYWATPVTANNWDGGPITPWIGQAIRYAFPFLGMLAASGAALLGTGRIANNVLAPAALIAGLIDSSTQFMWLAAGLLLLGLALHHVSAQYGWGGRLMSMSVAVVAVGVLVTTLHRTREAARTRLYRGLPAFIDRVIGPDDVIGYVLSNESYLFYGTHFDRTVAYTPAGNTDRETWIAQLRERHVTVLGIGPVRPEWRRRTEFTWIHDTGGTFSHVFGRDDAVEPVLYRVNPAPSGH